MNYLIDNSFLHAFGNKKDFFHQKCTKFYEKNESSQFFIPFHAFFEYYASKSDRERKETFQGASYKPIAVKFVTIDEKLFNNCLKGDLFRKFSKLRGMDLIYACITYLGNFTLVTCDGDFEQYAEEIKLQLIE